MCNSPDCVSIFSRTLFKHATDWIQEVVAFLSLCDVMVPTIFICDFLSAQNGCFRSRQHCTALYFFGMFFWLLCLFGFLSDINDIYPFTLLQEFSVESFSLSGKFMTTAETNPLRQSYWVRMTRILWCGILITFWSNHKPRGFFFGGGGLTVQLLFFFVLFFSLPVISVFMNVYTYTLTCMWVFCALCVCVCVCLCVCVCVLYFF